MKKYFITGLVILLPLALTLAILIFIFNLLTEPFVGIVQAIMSHYGILQKGFLILSSYQLQVVVSQVLILALLFLFTLFLGLFARWFFINSLFRLGDYLIERIPLVRSIYKTTQEVIKTLFTSSSKSFKQVVLVPFPNVDTWSIGLVTSDTLNGIIPHSDVKLVAVFVPTTPNPTSGFLMMFKEEEIHRLNMSVEEAFKYILSCGVIRPDFNIPCPIVEEVR